MNSEKVKEIKKALEDNANYEHYDKLGYIDGYKCKTVTYADILTYINELESENKSLQDLCNKTYENLTKEIDRLEKEKTEQLKQFAERLIDKKIKLGESFNIYDIDETLKEFIKD